MKFGFKVSTRLLFQGSKKLNAMTFFAFLAIAVGVWALGTLISVMYGFESTLKERVLKAHPHFIVKGKSDYLPFQNPETFTQKVLEFPFVEKAFAYLESEMIVRSGYRTLGAVVRGIPKKDFDAIGKANKESLTDEKNPQVILGSELGYRLGVNPKEKIRIISPFEKEGLLGAIPRWETYEVKSLYASGHYDFDQQYLFLELEEAQMLLKKAGRISGFQIWIKNLRKTDEYLSELKKILPPDCQIESWRTFNSALFQSLKLEQFAMFSILSFATLMASLNMVIVLLMQVNHKKRYIGILRAIGASQKDIRRLFTIMGALIGGGGLVIGFLLTVLTFYVLKHFTFFQLPSIYYDRTIPIDFRPFEFTVIYLFSALLILISTLYPASLAAKETPIAAIREG